MKKMSKKAFYEIVREYPYSGYDYVNYDSNRLGLYFEIHLDFNGYPCPNCNDQGVVYDASVLVEEAENICSMKTALSSQCEERKLLNKYLYPLYLEGLKCVEEEFS